MKRCIIMVLGCLAVMSGCATMGGNTEATVLRAKDRAAPALVHIRPVKEVFTQGRRQEVVVVGSGFIISPDGYVVTNEHVAGESTIVRCVLYDKEEVEAHVVGADRFTDLAVLKLETDRRDLPVATLGSSSDLESGQTVIALGSPHGLSRSVSKGIISVTDRYIGDRGAMTSPYNTWIQTDAAINQGNSGGPLVNLRGEVIGVNARRLSGADNIGFAIPIDTAREVIDEIIATGKVTRSWFGATLQEMMAMTDDPTIEGVVIADVDPLSSGAEAGLRPGDIIVAIDGTPIHARFEEDLPGVQKRIADLPLDMEAPITVRRGGETTVLSVRTEEKTDIQGGQAELSDWGFTVAELTPAIARRAQLPSNDGVLVSGVQQGGIAATAGLAPGDVILTVDEQDVPDLVRFRRLYEERLETGQRLVLLEVRRAALTRYVLVKQDAAEPLQPTQEILDAEDLN